MKRLVSIGISACVLAAAVASTAAATLDDVKKRGMLNCGANGQLPGFGLPDSQGNWTGLDVDLCRAVAAAIRTPSASRTSLLPKAIFPAATT